jgi:hypothetical protein
VLIIAAIGWNVAPDWFRSGLAAYVRAGLFYHLYSTQESRPPRLRTAVALCDSSARAKLYLPSTMEFVSEPQAYDLNTMITVEREIAARDKYGTRYRYHYTCTAPADGTGGIGQVDVLLVPTND